MEGDKMRKSAGRIAGACGISVCILAGCFSGCGSRKKDYPYYISYVDSEQTQTIQSGYEPEHTSVDGLIQELLDRLGTDTDTVDYVKAIPEGVSIESWEVEQDCLRLDFNGFYDKMEPITEILCRLAIVKTMTQVEGIESVSFLVEGKPLKDSTDENVGTVTIDSFVENPGEQINSYQNATIDLYFANETGDGLVRETQEVYYNSNISMEKLVMEHLISGPKSKDALGTLPKETKLINVAVVDGSCYVNLDENFKNQNYEILEPIVIYSIVNSLTSLDHIERVQISVNGDTSGKYRDDFELSRMYEKDYTYVSAAKSKSVVVEDVKDKPKGGGA